MSKQYMPQRVIFTPASFEYDAGKRIYDYFTSVKGVDIVRASMNKIKEYIPGESGKEKYINSKRTLVITTKTGAKLDVCKPSADYQFSLVTNCPGHCEYCYLQTTQGEKPFLRVYVNLEDIFDTIKKHIELKNDITTFEAASLGDPIALEHITGCIADTIRFFSTLDKGRLRIVTKYDNVDSLLSINHKKHTRFRVSVNSRYVIKNFEHNTSGFDERIDAAAKIASAGYPIGFIIAPIMHYDKWENEYTELLDLLNRKVRLKGYSPDITFELIQHRFTETAKSFILERFPNTKLDMDENKRKLKWGKFGRFKYVYTKDISDNIKAFIQKLIYDRFSNAKIEYYT